MLQFLRQMLLPGHKTNYVPPSEILRKSVRNKFKTVRILIEYLIALISAVKVLQVDFKTGLRLLTTTFLAGER
jgi:hypothetical protein